jgi:hypothetical protein
MFQGDNGNAGAGSPLTEKSDLAFLDNIDELNTSWPDYQVMQCCQHDALTPRRLGPACP